MKIIACRNSNKPVYITAGLKREGIHGRYEPPPYRNEPPPYRNEPPPYRNEPPPYGIKPLTARQNEPLPYSTQGSAIQKDFFKTLFYV